ncbi:SDR family oxidoreductase [Caldibacillus lycopersici]|uniref:SDR family oxidoreductase n=1 Tax=Perspicuibacillus lycopersici TaxID=1325689 RepID=A0AAE3LPE9_9BACI|nr:SDR family oxidoreductase [Perspicuibacillus lycopersici]MCU9612279.1 SDR family oxidoreductase [Perspicuibacillus lycopersici]
MEFNFTGKTALVAASSQGLGKAIAKEFVTLGANVMISGRKEEKLQKVKEELAALNKGSVEICETDLTDKRAIDQLIQKTIDSFGSIDILVNNSGGPPTGSFEDFTDEDWQYAFELNLLSYIRLIRGALPALKQSTKGKIINIASSSVKEPIPGLILSNTFRTGIIGLAKTLSIELAPFNILVNTICPGRIETDRIKMLDEVNANKLGITTQEYSILAKKNIPLNRYGTPEEFAKVATFLASDLNTYMTGSTFFVDGGAMKSI